VNGTGMDLLMKGVNWGCAGTDGMDLHGHVSCDEKCGPGALLMRRRYLFLFEISRIDFIKWRIAEVKRQ
jgi:hypothetical protein